MVKNWIANISGSKTQLTSHIRFESFAPFLILQMLGLPKKSFGKKRRNNIILEIVTVLATCYEKLRLERRQYRLQSAWVELAKHKKTGLTGVPRSMP